jgi:transposase
MKELKMSVKGLNVKRTWGGCKKIDSLIKKEKDARIKERLQAVLWRLENEDYTKIAKRLNRHIDTVRKWIKNWNKSGYDGLFDKPKSGRPTILNKEEIKEIVDEANTTEKQGRETCKSIAKKIVERFNKEMSTDAIRAMFIKYEISWKKPEKVDYRRDEDKRKTFLEDFFKKGKRFA